MLLAVLLAVPALALQGGAPAAARQRTALRVNNIPGLAGLAPKS